MKLITNLVMNLWRRLRLPGLLTAALVLSACASSNGPGSTFSGAPSAAEFATMSAEARAAAAQDVGARSAGVRAWWDDIARPIYLAGEPVQIGSRETGYTMQWVRSMDGRSGFTYFYPGHSNGGMGMEQNAMLVVATDGHGNFVNQDRPGGGSSPVVMLANVATQEGVGRFFARGAFQVAGSALNGVAAAQIHANAACDNNCGDPVNIQVGSWSNAEATGTGNATSTAGGCPECAIIRE